MALSSSSSGRRFLAELVDVLGLSDATQKVVIVAEVNDVARIYVKGILKTDNVPGIVQAVKDITVNDDGTVYIVPLVAGE